MFDVKLPCVVACLVALLGRALSGTQHEAKEEEEAEDLLEVGASGGTLVCSLPRPLDTACASRMHLHCCCMLPMSVCV